MANATSWSLFTDLASPTGRGDLQLLLIGYAEHVVFALVILVGGLYLARKLSSFLRRRLESSKADNTLARFAANLVYYVLVAVVVISALGQLGIRTTSFLAVLGTAGLAVGLALKNQLSNFAAGVMLMLFRPFKVGQYVTAGGVTGKVQIIDTFDTTLLTDDNQIIVVPNARITGNIIINSTALDSRRLELSLAFDASVDLGALREALAEAAGAVPRVQAAPAPEVLVADVSGGKLTVRLRVWCPSGEFQDLDAELKEAAAKALKAREIVPA